MVKCIVWDLDNTIWDGILSEDDEVALKPHIREIIALLDSRGILHSIASRNNHDDAMKKLREYELESYFLFPEINWGTKSASIGKIQQNLNLRLASFLFIDDQPFEREEVKSVYPEILCMDAAEYTKLPELKVLTPERITEDTRHRRKMYLNDIVRKSAENNFRGPKREFLEGLNMELTISEASYNDLERAEELTIRTNQLNATGTSFSREELHSLILSENHLLLICRFEDRFGSYGKIGLILISLHDKYWHLKLLIVSCRVKSRGIGTVLLSFIMNLAKSANKQLLADFVDTGKNKMMFLAYKFAGFQTKSKQHAEYILENDLSFIQEIPGYFTIHFNHSCPG